MKSNAILALVAVALVMDAATAQPSVVPSPSQPVKVTNDSTSPVPVTVNGGVGVSGPVTVGNTTANPVPVTLQGTPVPVTIQGTPVPVSLQGSATVSGNVNATLTNPFVPVTVIDDLANAPVAIFHRTFKLVIEDDVAIDGRVQVTAKLNVPDGKRFIVETVSVAGEVNFVNNVPNPVRIDFTTVGGTGSIPVQSASDNPEDRSACFSGCAFYTATLPLKLRVDAIPGSQDELMFTIRTRFPIGSSFPGTRPVKIEATAFGYLVALP